MGFSIRLLRPSTILLSSTSGISSTSSPSFLITVRTLVPSRDYMRHPNITNRTMWTWLDLLAHWRTARQSNYRWLSHSLWLSRVPSRKKHQGLFARLMDLRLLCVWNMLMCHKETFQTEKFGYFEILQWVTTSIVTRRRYSVPWTSVYLPVPEFPAWR